jgi:hypothetical protein
MKTIDAWRFGAACMLLVGLPLAAACSSSDSGEENLTDGSELEILFPKMHSAFDGQHDFRVPAKVVGVKNVKWSAEPADAVVLEKQGDGSVLITTKKAGDVKIIAKAGNLKATAPLTILQTTPDAWKEGSERYNNGVIRQRGGRREAGAPRGERMTDPALACTNCHAKGGKGNDVEHTPMQTAGYSDEELIKIFSEGTKPEGVAMRTTSRERWQKMHKWTMEPEEKTGIIVYLRSLEPEAQGEIDFGGRGSRGGDGDRGNGGQGGAPN